MIHSIKAYLYETWTEKTVSLKYSMQILKLKNLHVEKYQYAKKLSKEYSRFSYFYNSYKSAIISR